MKKGKAKDEMRSEYRREDLGKGVHGLEWPAAAVQG
jgi:hypothetical protein